MKQSLLRRGMAVVLLAAAACGVQAAAATAGEQSEATGKLRGRVTLEANGDPLHKAFVLIVPLNRSTQTDSEGNYEFDRVPPGSYDVVVHAPALADERRSVTVTAGDTATLDFSMRIAPVHAQITVTASGQEETVLEAFQATTTVGAIELTQRAQTGLGDVLKGEVGVAKRSFGAGSARPVLRGFDGDRVLILMDGLSTGTLSSQSGDHGENLNVLNLERVEVVRGPATLLYGSNAIGGVVNAITGHQQIYEHAHTGLSGYVSAVAGSGNAQAGGSAGFEYGLKRWLLWGGGGGQRTGDYGTPAETIVNSRTRSGDGRGGIGWYGQRAYFSLGYNYDNRRYGVPFAAFLENGPPFDPAAETVNLRLRKHDVQFTGGLRNLTGAVEEVRVLLGYNHYRHGEYDADTLETDFFNKQFNYRVTFEQKRRGPLTGTFGFSGLWRDYRTEGDEALAPPTRQVAVALFALETLDFGRVSLQFGGRFEHTRYDPDVLDPLLPALPERSFTGLSGAAGVRVRLWEGGAVVANYTHSYRAPALEELYNRGPHPGNLAYEIGNPQLGRERGDGLDLSLRHQSERFRVTANFFHYSLKDYVFLTPTGNITAGLYEAEFLQGDARYRGGELEVEVGVHPNVWVSGGFDRVEARLTRAIRSTVTGLVTPADTPLPRIPPMQGRAAVDFRWKGLSVKPEGVFAGRQGQVFTTETSTDGYALFQLEASYTVARKHVVHVIGVNAFNLTNALYRNHLSYIKHLAPEMGRGVRISYTLRVF
jgi:iron complex outermembrane receptor protein